MEQLSKGFHCEPAITDQPEGAYEVADHVLEKPCSDDAELPAGSDWPRCEERVPEEFLRIDQCQIAFKDISKGGTGDAADGPEVAKVVGALKHGDTGLNLFDIQ